MLQGPFADSTPDKPAVIRPATGEQITYAQLETRSAQLAHLLTDEWGFKPGDTIAVVSDNTLEMVEIYWGALRSGLYIAAINHHLTAEESSYIIGDCGARALFVSAAVADHVDLTPEAHPAVEHRVAFGGALDGLEDYRGLLEGQPTEAPADQPRGHDFLYSSGTTGRPKGVRVDLPEGQIDEVPDLYTPVFSFLYAFDADSVYLCPAPLYHAAPLRFCGVVNSVGGTVILMDRFDPEEVERNPFWCPDAAAAAIWAEHLDELRKSGNSVGAVVEVVASGVPAGLGAPIYGKLDSDLAAAMMSINAVKGVEIGAGMAAAELTGVENADEIFMGNDGRPRFSSNHAGGVLGGISTGQDVVVRFAVKPTSSVRVVVRSAPHSTPSASSRAMLAPWPRSVRRSWSPKSMV